MCITNNLQRHIRNLTGDGEVVARFLIDTVEGKHTGAKYHHKLEATKHLIRFGFTDEEQSQFWGLLPTPEELAEKQRAEKPPLPQGEGWGEGENPSKPVTHLDILNYDIAHLIRQETAEGHTIAEFLSDVMTRRDKPYTPKKLRIRHVDRMAAAREILRRGFGHFGRKRKLAVDDADESNDYDTLHTDLAKRMREYSEHGTDAVRFLLDVMEDANPEEPYTWHHRMSAALELLRRGWDTNYDSITSEMLQDYWRDQQSTRLSVGQKKQLAGLPATLDDYNTYDNKDYQALANNKATVGATGGRPPTTGTPEDHEAISPMERVKAPAKSSSKSSETQTDPKENPLSLRERARVRVKSPESSPTKDNTSSPSCTSLSIPDDDRPDCYYKPLDPDDEAAFNYQTQIESGEYMEGEITIRQPTPEDWKAFKVALRQITEIAAAEGVPLVPNPLAGTFKHPPIRSP